MLTSHLALECAWLRHLAFPVAGFLMIAYVLYEMDTAAKVLGACWLGIGVVYYLLLIYGLKRPAALEI